MRHLYIILLTIALSKPGMAQNNYPSLILPTEFGNVNANSMITFNSKILVDGIFGGSRSCLFLLDSTSLSLQNTYFYDSTTFSFDANEIIDNRLITYSKNRQKSKGLELLTYDESFRDRSRIPVETDGIYNFPAGLLSIGSKLYAGYFYHTPEEDYNIDLVQLDTAGNRIWTLSLNEANSRYTYLWATKKSLSNQLLSSYVVAYNNNKELYRDGRIAKVDTAGYMVWLSDTLRRVESGGTSIHFTELSDSSLVVVYQKDMRHDPDFVFNLMTLPPTFIRLDKNGKLVSEDVQRISRGKDVFVTGLHKGRGDYFFAYGESETNTGDERYGFITKYANNGDTIWTHNYRHHDYNLPRHIYNINDIIEAENGDLTVLGSITPVGQKTQVWVFRVNSAGCFGTEACDPFVLHAAKPPAETRRPRLHPNPTYGKVKISDLPSGTRGLFTVSGAGGKIHAAGAFAADEEIDVSTLPTGVYFVSFITNAGNHTAKLVKF